MIRISAILLFSIACLWICLMTGATATVHAGTTLDRIKAAGSLPCGINIEEPEYSTQDAHGNHSVFDADICKAVAVAVLGSNAKFTVVPFRDEQDALTALKSGQIALLATGSPNFINTASFNTTNVGFGFARPMFYDYQGFLVNKTMGINSPQDLAGKKICYLGGTEIETQLQSYMQRENIRWLPFPFEEEGEMEAAFVTRNCAAITADVSQLAYERLGFKSMAKNFEILPDVIAKDPLAPTYRLDDPQCDLSRRRKRVQFDRSPQFAKVLNRLPRPDRFHGEGGGSGSCPAPHEATHSRTVARLRLRAHDSRHGSTFRRTRR